MIVLERLLPAFALVVATGLLSAGCVGDDGRDSPTTTCQRVRDRVIALRVDSIPDSDRKAHAENLQATIGARLVADCQTSPERHRDCVLQSDTMSELRRCGTPSLNSPTE